MQNTGIGRHPANKMISYLIIPVDPRNLVLLLLRSSSEMITLIGRHRGFQCESCVYVGKVTRH